MRVSHSEGGVIVAIEVYHYLIHCHIAAYGVNGFVVHSRDEKDFALKMDKAVDLDRSALREYNSKYKLLSMEFLREEMLSVI